MPFSDKRTLLRFVVGPALTLLCGIALVILARSGIHIAYNKELLVMLTIFSAFHAGVGSALTTLVVAGTLYVGTVLLPGTIPDFTRLTQHEIVQSILTLPLIVGMVGLLRRRLDSKLHAAEEGKQLSDARLEVLLAHAPVAILTTDKDGIITMRKGSGGARAGVTANSGIGTSFFAQFKDVPRHTENARRALRGEFFTDRLAVRDGFYQVAYAPLMTGDGRIEGMVGVATDITGEAKIESERRELLSRFHALLDNAPIAIFSTDKDGILTMREGRGGARAGVQVSQGIGTSYFEQFKDVPAHLENVRKALGGTTLSDRLRVRDGYFAIVYVPLKNVDGSANGMVGIATDITEQWEAEQKAKDLSAMKSRFITVVAHQLRTPLSAMRWNLESILGDEVGKLKKAQKDLLQMTHLANIEIITRIGDFLQALDIEEGRSIVVREPHSIETLWESVLVGVRNQCHSKGLEFQHRPPTRQLPDIPMDVEKIRFAMKKLADNALHYTKYGVITSAISERDGRIRFGITDTGIGIPEKEQMGLFHRFFRATNAQLSLTDASGISLYVAKHYIEGHGGRIGFESAENKGSTFWFEIPLA